MTPKVLVVVCDDDLAELLGADRSQRQRYAKAEPRLEEDRVDGAEIGASSAIAGPRSTAAPNVSPDRTRRRALLVASGVCRRQQATVVCALPSVVAGDAFG